MAIPRQPTKLRPREGVFISYARSDGANIANELRGLLQLEGIEPWQDVLAMEGGKDWWLQITDALNHVEYMALVLSPNALRSETMRKEWTYARQHGVCIYPISPSDSIDVSQFPRWLQKKHIYNLSKEIEWQKFLNDLETRCNAPRVPMMLDNLTDFVPRPEEYQQLLTNLLNRKDNSPVAITAALRGAGGYGKTTLAKALCHDEAVQEAFDDGILWVTLGENPGDLTGRVADLIETLTGDRPGFTDVNVAAVRLRQILSGRDVLMVVDDLWNPAHLSPFLLGTGACLITTRVVDTLPPNTKRVTVDAMRRDEAVNLLGAGLPAISKAQLVALSAQLGEWPLLLRIVNGVLRHRVNTLGQNPSGALAWVNTALAHRGLTAFDAHSPQSREQAVQRTLAVSLDQLDDHEIERYDELAVFPEDIEIPLAALGKLWALRGLDEFETEELCERLDRLSLLQRFDPNRRVITLHDVVRNYLISKQGDRLPSLHAALLEAHQPQTLEDRHSGSVPCVWAEIHPREPYLWDQLLYHLAAAERLDELTATVKDVRYLAAKVIARNTVLVERDLLDAERLAASDRLLPLLRRRFVQSGHLLDQCTNRTDAEMTWFNRLLHENELQSLTEMWVPLMKRPFLRALHALPDLPNPFLVRTVSAHSQSVNGIAISSNGSLLASVSDDESVKVWEVSSGELVRTLSGHDEKVNACAMSPNNTALVSISEDGEAKVWSLPSGKLRTTLWNRAAMNYDGQLFTEKSNDGITKVGQVATQALARKLLRPAKAIACAIANSGSILLAATERETLYVWRMQSREVLCTLNNTAPVTACAISTDGGWVFTGTTMGEVSLWEVGSGRRLWTWLDHETPVTACAISDDGTMVMSGSEDGTVIVWKASTGELVQTLYAHGDSVKGCALTGEQGVLVSGSVDGSLKVWNLSSHESGRAQIFPAAIVNGCAISHDGNIAVSASEDGWLKVWNVITGRLVKEWSAHSLSANACAISREPTCLVSVSDDQLTKVWDLASGTLRYSLSEHVGSVNACAINSDATIAVSVGDDETVKVWDLETGELSLTLKGHNDWVNGCAMTADGGIIASASADGTVKVWTTADGELKQTLSGLAIWLNGCAMSPDGKTVVSVSADGKVKIWEVNTGRSVRTLVGHSAAASSCAISEDGHLVLSTSTDGTIKVWHAETGECLTTLYVDGPIYACSMHDQAKLIIAGGTGGLYFFRYVDK